MGTAPKGNSDKKIADSAKVGNLFNLTGNVTDADALNGARRAVIAASGEDILAAIQAAKGSTGGTAGAITAAKNAFEMAIANKSHGSLTTINTNASAIAAGLALKAMAQGGKLATLTTLMHHKGE